MTIEVAKLRLYPAAILFTSLVGSLFSPVYAADEPRVQDFVVTAYYSPLPNQCCYFRGSYEEEIAFNGNGTHGADGTPVYTGMIAGPPEYAFGTTIELPGLGVGTIHDRGSRIVEWGDDLHRIDVWVGSGEEGLARAMAWGVRRVKGTVYPADYASAPREQFSVQSIDADPRILKSLPKIDPLTILTQATFGDSQYGVRALQATLSELNYFQHPVTGQFGEVTRDALKAFLTDYGLQGDGQSVSPHIAATLVAAASLTGEHLPDLAAGLARGSNGDDVRQAQKLLRFLGAYRGRTDGVFSAQLKESVMAFQTRASVIGTAQDPGAGRIGPATVAAILQAWKVKVARTKAESIASRLQVAEAVKRDSLPAKTLAKGDHGEPVRKVQRILEDLGYLERKDVTGTFGSRTAVAIKTYQQDRKIIASAEAHGAGVLGPATRQVLLAEAVELAWKRVRAGEGKALSGEL